MAVGICLALPPNLLDFTTWDAPGNKVGYMLDQNVPPGGVLGDLRPGRRYGLDSFNVALSPTGTGDPTYYAGHAWRVSSELNQLLALVNAGANIPVSAVVNRVALNKPAPPGGWLTQAELDAIVAVLLNKQSANDDHPWEAALLAWNLQFVTT